MWFLRDGVSEVIERLNDGDGDGDDDDDKEKGRVFQQL